MTAEIGVMNKIGVALAADSAVTVGSFNKIFNSAEKLFALSKIHPVGIMIYGNAEFMGIPWETVIKMFRKKLNDQRYDNLYDYCEDLIDFLKQESRFNTEGLQKLQVSRIYAEWIGSFFSEVSQVLNDNFPSSDEEQVLGIIYGELDFHYRTLSDKKYANDFSKDYITYFIDKYYDTIKEIVELNVNIHINDKLMDIFVNVAANLVCREVFSDSYSGVVIAGFGDQDLFPSLYGVKIEGIFENKLKYELNMEENISENNSASIVPFAQQEMVHSFITGIDPALNNEFYSMVEQITQVFPNIVEQIAGVNISPEKMEILKEQSKKMYQSFAEIFDEYKRRVFINPITQTVASFPKEELAAMAEALVNLTSIKRKVTTQAETVGGPIDVAVISKGDGFIWIKRKHYFKQELNHQFFHNYNER